MRCHSQPIENSGSVAALSHLTKNRLCNKTHRSIVCNVFCTIDIHYLMQYV